MDYLPFFKSIIDSDNSEIVICDSSHRIVYVNPTAAARYIKHGDLVGKNLLDCHSPASRDSIKKVVEYFKQSPDNNSVFTVSKPDKDIYMIALRDDNGSLIGYYEKHCYLEIMQ